MPKRKMTRMEKEMTPATEWEFFLAGLHGAGMMSHKPSLQRLGLKGWIRWSGSAINRHRRLTAPRDFWKTVFKGLVWLMVKRPLIRIASSFRLSRQN